MKCIVLLLSFLLLANLTLAQDITPSSIPMTSVDIDGDIVTIYGPGHDVIAEYIICESTEPISPTSMSTSVYYTSERWQPWPDVELWVTRKVIRTVVSIDTVRKRIDNE